jgi:uncharacterized protein YaeQ
VALPSTLYHLRIDLSDVERGVYEHLDLRIGRHPSEGTSYLLTRVLAYCLCHEEGIAFSRGGLSSPDEPALSVCTPDGRRQAWIEVGLPAPDRLARAARAAARVVVFAHREPGAWLRDLRGHPLARADRVEIFALDPAALEALGAVTERHATWTVVRTGDTIYVTVGDDTFSIPLHRHDAAGES